MKITKLQNLSTILEELFPIKSHYEIATIMISRILFRWLVNDEPFNSISLKYCQLFLRDKKIIRTVKQQLVLNGIITKISLACPMYNIPSFYKINSKYLIKDQLQIIQLELILSLYRIKQFYHKSSIYLSDINNNTYIPDRGLFCEALSDNNLLTMLMNFLYSKLLKQNYTLNFSFNMLNILQVVKRLFNDNTITWLKLLKQLLIFNTQRQARIIYGINCILNPDMLLVHIGSKGGRLHHQFCSMINLIWHLIHTIKLNYKKVSIDVVACQVKCFLKYFGRLPLPLHNALLQGNFYETINNLFYNNSKTRLLIKTLIFSKFFNGKGYIWTKLKTLYPMYCESVLLKINKLNKQNIKVAAILQRTLSNLFNQLFKNVSNSIIRYDLIIVACDVDIDHLINNIQILFNDYFNSNTPLHIHINNNIYIPDRGSFINIELNLLLIIPIILLHNITPLQLYIKKSSISILDKLNRLQYKHIGLLLQDLSMILKLPTNIYEKSLWLM